MVLFQLIPPMSPIVFMFMPPIQIWISSTMSLASWPNRLMLLVMKRLKSTILGIVHHSFELFSACCVRTAFRIQADVHKLYAESAHHVFRQIGGLCGQALQLSAGFRTDAATDGNSLHCWKGKNRGNDVNLLLHRTGPSIIEISAQCRDSPCYY